MARTRSATEVDVKPKKIKKQARLPLAIKHKDYLTLLSKTKNTSARKKLIDAGDKGQIGAVSECIKNIIEGNVPLSRDHLRQLQRYKTVLRKLAKKCSKQRNPTRYRQKLLKQHGGFLPMLMPLAISALTGLAKNIFSS